MCVNNIDFCQRLKKDYYVKNIKMLYSWSRMTEHEILEHINALGLFDHINALKWLLTNKANLNAEINKNIRNFVKEDSTQIERGQALDNLRVALVICNKTQAVTILTSIAQYSSNPKDDIKYLTTF